MRKNEGLAQDSPPLHHGLILWARKGLARGGHPLTTKDTKVPKDSFSSRWTDAQMNVAGIDKLLIPMRNVFRICRQGRRADWFLAFLAFVLGTIPASAQTQTEPADVLVRKTVANELKPGSDNYMFRSRKQASWGSQTHIYVQTKEATAGMLVAENDEPLDAAKRQAEIERLDYLVQNPGELRRKQKHEREDGERINRIVRALPDAFLYQYDGTEQSRAGVGYAGDELVRLKFQPNPKYDPPTRVEQVLTGMQGIVLIDTSKHRIAKIDGTLYKEVSFGWGFFGHLDKGGKYQVEQSEVADGEWEITRMALSFTGKILLFKKLLINTIETFSDFQKIPSNLTFAAAVTLLKEQEGAASSSQKQ